MSTLGCKGARHKQDRHNCTLLINLKIFLSDLNTWRVHITGSHVPPDGAIKWQPQASAKQRIDEKDAATSWFLKVKPCKRVWSMICFRKKLTLRVCRQNARSLAFCLVVRIVENWRATLLEWTSLKTSRICKPMSKQKTHASTSDTAPPSGQTVAVLLQHKTDKKDHSAEGSSVSESTQQESQENTNDIVTLYEIVDQQGQVVYQAAVDQNTQHGESSDFQAVTAQANMDLQNIEVSSDWTIAKPWARSWWYWCFVIGSLPTTTKWMN